MNADNIHDFEISGSWEGSRQGQGRLHLMAGDWECAIPTALGGVGGARTNPEELLLASLASCYSITLSIIAEHRRLPLQKVELTAHGKVERLSNGGLRFVSIQLKPILYLASEDETDKVTAVEMAHRAEQHCLISNAIRGNVAVTVQPEVTQIAASA